MDLDWVAIGSISTAVTAVVAFFAIRQSNKRLKIEQTPGTVVDKIDKKASIAEISIKNIGRGPAFHITCCKSKDFLKRNEAFFIENEPHSVNLATGKEHLNWRAERKVFDSLTEDNEGYKHLYVYCESQLRTIYRTDVKIKDLRQNRGSDCYIVMENKIEEINVSECN